MMYYTYIYINYYMVNSILMPMGTILLMGERVSKKLSTKKSELSSASLKNKKKKDLYYRPHLKEFALSLALL